MIDFDCFQAGDWLGGVFYITANCFPITGGGPGLNIRPFVYCRGGIAPACCLQRAGRLRLEYPATILLRLGGVPSVYYHRRAGRNDRQPNTLFLTILVARQEPIDRYPPFK